MINIPHTSHTHPRIPKLISLSLSWLQGFNRPNAYIATQGPQPSTFPDFWRMVWEFDCPTIVMVTNLKEEDKVCAVDYVDYCLINLSPLSFSFSLSLPLSLSPYS